MVITLGLVAFIGGTVAALQIESTNTGCATCHTQPETQFVDRAQAAPRDLAAAHAAEKVACIDCHSRVGALGRAEALLLGARNTVAFVSGQYHSPAVMLFPLDDTTCTKCHAEVLNDARSANHFHFYLAQWQRLDPAGAAHCATCHTGHPTDSTADTHYLNAAISTPICQRCHAQARAVVAWP